MIIDDSFLQLLMKEFTSYRVTVHIYSVMFMFLIATYIL